MTERLTLDELPDWAREIAESASAPATPHVRDHQGKAAWPFFVEAATVGAFLPRELVPALAGSERRDAEKSVLRFAELTQGPDGARWSLTREARTAVLACSNPQEIAQAVERTERFNDPITIALREALQTANRRELRTLSISELEAVRIAVTWLRDLENLELPSLQELDRVISFKRLLEPFRRMVGQKAEETPGSPRRDRFFGRTEEMEDLRAYVGVVAADRIGHRVKRAAKFVQRLITGRQPKVVWGSGGSGKTTLIAKFMLEHGESAESRFPFAYIDFDRSTVSARNRAALLAEMCRQVSCQFESLTEPMTELRNQLADLALRIDVSTDADSISLLLPLAQQFRKLIDDAFESSQPFLLVFDTFEIVQYGPDQVIALEKLVSAISGGAANSWPRLRLIIAGRQKVPQFLGAVEERELGALDKEGSAEMLEAMAADAGKPITRDDATKLVEVIAKHVRDKSNTGVRPLRLRLIGQLFSDHDESGTNVVQGLLADLNKPPSEQGLVGKVLVDGILVRRILNHVKDPRVHALADPGLVVRRITPDVIRDVMTRGTAKPDGSCVEPADSETIEPWIVTDDEAQDIFAAFGRDLNLVEPDGAAYRHRQDVRQDMLPLIQIRRPFGFQRVHGLAYEFFKKRALADPNDFASAGEAIYHGLWLRLPCEQIEQLWPKAPTFDPRIDPDEFELGTLENIYLRARKKGRLTPAEIAMLPSKIAVEWLGSRGEELLAQQRLDEGIAEVRAVGGTDYAAFDERRDVAATAARLLYRGGLWTDAAALLKRHVRGKLQIRRADVISLVRTWATILAKSGAEAEQLAALLPTAQAIQDPVIRTEILAHIALGLDDSHEWTRTRESARTAAMRSAFDVRPSLWARETRTLRLVLATRSEGYERLVGTYLETCARLPQDQSAVAFLSAQRQGQP
ncbi:MAG TPA: ATP-binding protein, partial [Thermoanaerobaculia bacterium]